MEKLLLLAAVAVSCAEISQAAPQDYNNGEVCPTAIDVVFVLDESGSIYYQDFDKQLQFVNDYIDRFDTSQNVTHVGVTTFSDNAKTQIPLSSHPIKEALKQRVKAIKQRRGQTMTHDALDHMTQVMKAGSRPGVPHVAIVITDGDPDDKVATDEAAARAQAAGIFIVAIGVGRWNIGIDVLLSIASNPNVVYHIENYDGLDHILLRLTQATCEVTTVPTTPPFHIPDCETQATLDIAFALPDFTGATDTGLALNFVSELAGEFKLGATQVQIAITPRYCYDDEPIYLNQYDRVDRFRSTLVERRHIAGASTGYHLNHMISQTFTEHNGARKGAIKVGILVVDEDSNDRELSNTIDAAEEMGVRLIVIGVGNRVSDAELNLIASTRSDIFRATSYKELGAIQDDIVDRLCEVVTQS